ncbi:hypothetical protein L1987_21560 [Smallanthus sonchifolius]|uniref:Uncharacterized protein n=1 Tax=Smallanthus sonchifolius TaxID=185202 RepID=A0ACB9IVY0_9ASTR|nr:hypothetical protein L1987_21560 [Smallanthus sonchifolius]
MGRLRGIWLSASRCLQATSSRLGSGSAGLLKTNTNLMFLLCFPMFAGCVFFTVMLRDFQTDLSDLQISANIHRKSDLSNRSFRSANVAFSSFTGGDETNLGFIQIERERG